MPDGGKLGESRETCVAQDHLSVLTSHPHSYTMTPVPWGTAVQCVFFISSLSKANDYPFGSRSISQRKEHRASLVTVSPPQPCLPQGEASILPCDRTL